MRKKVRGIILLLLIICSQSLMVDAHSGRTDSSGGHRDNKNKSGLGSYHYHCGGYPAHLHTNGCPYKSGGSNTSSSSSSSSNSSQSSSSQKNQVYAASVTKDDIRKKGSQAGYEDGYALKDYNAYSYSGTYSAEYKEAYEESFEKGKEKILQEKENAKEQGYKDGLENNHYNKFSEGVLYDAYEEGYEEGKEKYIENKKIEYTKLAEEDCINNKTDRTFENVDEIFVETYKEAYEKKYKEVKSVEYKSKGYNDGIKNKFDENIEADYKSSYKEGYNQGNKEREEMLNLAYEQGYDGEELKINDKYDSIKSEIESVYQSGKKDSRKDMVMGVGAVGIIGVSGVGIYRRIKSKRS